MFSLSIYPCHNQGSETSYIPYDADHQKRISCLLLINSLAPELQKFSNELLEVQYTCKK